MDFITNLPLSNGFDAIFVVVDRFTKMLHLFPCHTTDSAADTALLFLRVIALHGVPRSIVSDRDPRFTSVFWGELFKRLGTDLKLSSAYHPQTDGKTERTNQTI